MSNAGIALPPGATLVGDPSQMALPPGATLVSAGKQNAPPTDESLWGRIKAALVPRPFYGMDKNPDGSPKYKSQEEYSAAMAGKPHELPGSTEGPGMLEGLSDYDKASGGEIGGGVHDISNGNVAKGLHRVITGFMAASTPVAVLAAPAAAAAPITTALGAAGGIAGAKVARAGAEAMGATPDQADLAGDIGGFAGGYAGSKLPTVAAKAALLGRSPEEAYQSALKPSTTIPPAKVDKIVQTGLKNAIPVSEAGTEKLGSLLDDLHDKVSAEIAGGQGKTIDPQAVAQRADSVKARFANQVNAGEDLDAIEAVKQRFLEEQGMRPGKPAVPPKPTGVLDAQGNPVMSPAVPAQPPTPAQPIPAADAQAMKVGTYQQLKGKAYGELKGATIEAQKALARGIKEELASQFPELSALNAAEGSLYDLQPVLEKAVQRVGNHQLLGIGTPIAAGATKAVTGSSGAAAIVGTLKAVVDNPVVKSHLAIALDRAGVPPGVAAARIQSYVGGLAASAASAEQNERQNNE